MEKLAGIHRMTRLDAATHTWLAARGMLLDRCDEFYLQFTRVREAFDPEAIHDLRVASRRLREGIALFTDCFRKKQLRPLRRELKTLTNILGAIRNSDEAILFFTSLQQKVDEPATVAIQGMIETLQKEREKQRRTLKRDLKNLDPGALLGRMDEMRNKPRIFNPAAQELFKPVGVTLLAAIAARGDVLRELLPSALLADNITAQHRLRIAVKRFRYRLEFLAPLASPDYKQFYTGVKKFQEVLGRMHDLDVFAELAVELIPEAGARESVTGVIAANRRELFAAFLELHAIIPLDSLNEKVRYLL